MPKLVVKTHNKIKSYCKTGDEFAQDERYQDALRNGDLITCRFQPTPGTAT